jgi:hypothetical protein
MKEWWKDADRGKEKYSDVSQCFFFHTHMDLSGILTRFSALTGLSHGTVSFFVFQYT